MCHGCMVSLFNLFFSLLAKLIKKKKLKKKNLLAKVVHNGTVGAQIAQWTVANVLIYRCETSAAAFAWRREANVDLY